jgi:TolA-binding protein
MDGPVPEPPKRASDTADSKATAESSSRGKRAPSNADPRAIELGAVGAQPSDLALQNDLYARAIAARRNGQPREAAALYQELLTRFPRSPLAESAMSERMRIFRSSDRAQAIREARRYLARFPAGSARAEAEALLREP